MCAPARAIRFFRTPELELCNASCARDARTPRRAERSAVLRLGVTAGLGDQPFGKFAHLRFSGGELRSDDEIGARSDHRLSEGCNERARLDEVVDQGLAAQCDALPADCRLNHLLVLAEVERACRFELADAEG